MEMAADSEEQYINVMEADTESERQHGWVVIHNQSSACELRSWCK